jgi:hypothetical protein
MPVLVECLDPAIAGFNWELTTIALSLEHGGPIFRAVDLAVLIVEATCTYWLMALTAQEATHVEGVLHCINHFPDNCTAAFSTPWCEILFIILFTIQLSLLFNKSNVNEWCMAVRIGADEMIWAPSLVKSRYEWTPDGCSTAIAYRNPHAT